MTNIGIILGSTRPNRAGAAVAQWVYNLALSRSDAKYELVDVADLDLPLLDEAIPASLGQYQNAHTRAWAAQLADFDGFIFVTPEYNHSITGALKNAIDFVYGEWNNKAAGIVSYGSAGGARAAAAPARHLWPSSRSPTYGPRSCCPWSTTSRTTPSSSRGRITRPPSTRC